MKIMESKFKKKVCLDAQYENSIWYKVFCDCEDDDHTCTIEIEYDPEINMLVLNFYKNVCYDWWSCKDNILGKIQNLINRIKKAIRLIFTGTLEMQEFFMLQDISHIQNFIEAMQEGAGYCIEEKKKHDH